MILIITSQATIRGRLFGPGAQVALPIPEAVQLIAAGVAEDAFPADQPEPTSPGEPAADPSQATVADTHNVDAAEPPVDPAVEPATPQA